MWLDDSRYAWRRLRATPETVAIAAAMLALAIGLTTAMFTLADALLLRPVPFAGADRLAQVSMMSERGGRVAVAPAVFHAWRSTAAFEAMESAAAATAVIETASGPLARGSALVTPGLFNMLGVRPIRGRVFGADEGRAGSSDRVLISEDLWRSAFGADPGVIGRPLIVDREPAVVVGVLPADFRFPTWNTVLWRPMDFDAPPANRAAELPVAFGRFAARVPRADALRLATEAAHAADPSTAKLQARDRSLAGMVLDSYYQRAVPLLFGGVALVFLVLCANVSSLLLVRLADRRREISMCSALGASRRRLFRQAMTESSMLCAAGLIMGVALAWVLVAAARTFLPEAALLRTLNPLNLDLRALAMASAAGVLATFVATLWPTWLGTRVNAAVELKSGGPTGTESRGTRSLARGLVVSEIALACTLLAGATLLVRSFVNLSNADRGLDASGVVTARISLPPSAFKDPAARFAMTSTIETAIRALPGVERAALSFGLPPDGGSIHFGDGWRSDVAGAGALSMEVESYDVGADFFDLYRIPLLRGRTVHAGDPPGQVVVGERLAALLWPGVDPVGRSFSFDKQQYEVIGVAREINHPSIDRRRDRPEFYQALQSAPQGRSFFMMSVRCGASCPDGALIRQQLLDISPSVRVVDAGPLDAEYFEQLAGPRATAALGFVFAGVAVLGAAGGLFGVLSHAVGRRRREFGIRAALGSSPQQIRQLVLRDGTSVAAVGVALGAAGAWALGRALTALQYGVSGSDVVSWITVVTILLATVVAATWRPARQAARVDPVTLLRAE